MNLFYYPRKLTSLNRWALWANHKDTKLAKDLAKLYHLIVKALGKFQDKTYWDTEYFERSKVPTEFWGHCPDTSLWTEPKIIRVFKLPSYGWLRDKMDTLDNEDLRLPLKKTMLTEPAEETSSAPTKDSFQLNQPSYTLDIETSAFEDSPLKQLALKSIQLDDQFIPVTSENKPDLVKELRNKELRWLTSKKILK